MNLTHLLWGQNPLKPGSHIPLHVGDLLFLRLRQGQFIPDERRQNVDHSRSGSIPWTRTAFGPSTTFTIAWSAFGPSIALTIAITRNALGPSTTFTIARSAFGPSIALTIARADFPGAAVTTSGTGFGSRTALGSARARHDLRPVELAIMVVIKARECPGGVAQFLGGQLTVMISVESGHERRERSIAVTQWRARAFISRTGPLRQGESRGQGHGSEQESAYDSELGHLFVSP